jgi:hypothetical protein
LVDEDDDDTVYCFWRSLMCSTAKFAANN